MMNNTLPTMFTHSGSSTCRIDSLGCTGVDIATRITRNIVRILTANTSSTPVFDRNDPGGFLRSTGVGSTRVEEGFRNLFLGKNRLRLYSTKSGAHVNAMINNWV
jgi:hypothetical protein